jgi:DNA invertase Pin-like site-specific DNA recombinase
MNYIIAKYLRISAEDIDLDGFDKFESNSIANQRALLDDFIGRIPEFAGCEVIETLDDGRTGTNFLRPGVQKLIEMAQSGKVQCIVVKDLSRWGRNYLEVGDFLEQKFPAWGVRFISLNDCYDSAKLNGATGGIDIAFRNLIYDLYSQDLSEKVKSAKISAAKSGKYTNGLSFYGYVKDPDDPRKLVIDEKTADVVRRVFDLTAQGLTPNRIAKILNDERVPTAQDRKVELGEKRRWRLDDGSFWYGSVIANIVRDERYTGKLIYGKSRSIEVGSKGKQQRVPKSEWIVVPDAIPAIVSEEQYKAANRHITERRTHNAIASPSKLLFARKLKCGHCGLCMKSVHRTSDVKYHCFTKELTDKLGCGEYWVFEKDVAAAVLAALQQQVAFADNARRMLIERTEQITPGIEKLQAEVDRLHKQIEKTKTAKMGM